MVFKRQNYTYSPRHELQAYPETYWQNNYKILNKRGAQKLKSLREPSSVLFCSDKPESDIK